MTRTSFAVTTALFLATSSCEKEKAPESTPAPAVASVANAPSATPSGASASAAAAPNEAENIPVAADFEEEAEKTITKTNYKAELDALEAELKK